MANLAPVEDLSTVATRLERRPVPLADGARTTVHVARFDRRRTRLRIVALAPPQALAAWCGTSAVPRRDDRRLLLARSGNPAR